MFFMPLDCLHFQQIGSCISALARLDICKGTSVYLDNQVVLQEDHREERIFILLQKLQ